MDTTSHMDSERLARYVAGEADAAERAAVERWAAAAPGNRRELEAMQALWALSADGPAAPEVDVDAAWARLNARIGPAERTGRVVPLHRRPVMRWLAAAAVVSALTFTVLFRYEQGAQELTTATAYLTTTLHDSSHVVLSPGSHLQARMGDRRRVALRGEAYFEVARDTVRPFIVEAGEVRVTVLGTGFEVIAYDTSRVVLVRVRHGRVRVEADSGRVELLAGEEAGYDRAARRLVRAEVPSSVVWGDRILQFDRASMAQVADRLRTLFGVRIDLKNEALERCELTASFDNEPIETILQVISETFGMKVERVAKDHFILDGDGC